MAETLTFRDAHERDFWERVVAQAMSEYDDADAIFFADAAVLARREREPKPDERDGGLLSAWVNG